MGARDLLWLGALTLGGCASPCANLATGLEVTPSGGEHDAPDVVIEAVVHGEAMPADAAFTVTVDGRPLGGATHVDGERAVFEPQEVLPDGALIEVQLEAACGDATFTRDAVFATRDFVAPVADPSALVGHTYAAPGMSFRVTTPDGDVGAILEGALHMVWLPMLHVDAVDGEGVALSMFWANPFLPDEANQRPCSLPSSLSASLVDGDLSVEPADIDVLTGLGSVGVYGTRIDGRFSEDGQRLGRIAFSGSFDLRDLVGELGYGDDVAGFCADAEALGHPCTRCPDDAFACLEVAADTVTAVEVDIALEREDVCGVDGRLALWSRDHLVRADPRGLEVVRVEYDGEEGWRAALPSPIAFMVASPDRESTPRVVVVDDDGRRTWLDLDPDSGAVLDSGPYVPPAMAGAGDGLLWLLDAITHGGCAAAVCSTLPGSRTVPVFALLVALGAIRRRRG